MENNMENHVVAQQKVCVEANIVVTPDVQLGDVEACCIGPPVAEPCVIRDGECTCAIRQLMCIRIPIKFSARAETGSAAFICDKHCSTRLPPGSDQPRSRPADRPQPCCRCSGAASRQRTPSLLWLLARMMRG